MSFTEITLTILLVIAVLSNIITVILWKNSQSQDTTPAVTTPKEAATNPVTTAEKEAIAQNATHALDRTFYPTVYGTHVKTVDGIHTLTRFDGSRFRDRGILRRL